MWKTLAFLIVLIALLLLLAKGLRGVPKPLAPIVPAEAEQPRLAISFMTISLLASITTRRRGSCLFCILGMRSTRRHRGRQYNQGN